MFLIEAPHNIACLASNHRFNRRIYNDAKKDKDHPDYDMKIAHWKEACDRSLKLLLDAVLKEATYCRKQMLREGADVAFWQARADACWAAAAEFRVRE